MLGCVEVVEEDITLDRFAVTAFRKAEQKIVSLCDIEGRDAELSCGRAEGPKFVLKPAIGHLNRSTPDALLSLRRGFALAEASGLLVGPPA